MDKQKDFCDRKMIEYLFILLLFLSSTKVGGSEAQKKGLIPPLDLRNISPVIKTVMLESKKDDKTVLIPKTGDKELTTENRKKPSEQVTYKIRWGDTFWSIARSYGMSVAELSSINPELDPEKIKSGEYLQVRRESPPSRGRSTLRELPAPIIKDLFLFHPVSDARLTSAYGMRRGRMHYGIDLAAGSGTPIIAVSQGKVIFAGWKSGYGLVVILDHGEFQTKYAHNSENLVQKGDQVEAGKIIAKMGRTGNATGNHLHFELLLDGRAVNPLPYLESNSKLVKKD